MVVVAGVSSDSGPKLVPERPEMNRTKNKAMVNNNHSWNNEAAHQRSKRRLENIISVDDINEKKANKGKELTMQDMYNDINGLEDEEDDSDWEPCSKPPRLLTWFCCNCTMPNLDDVQHCDTCSEHKESGILKHGFLASPFLQDDVNQTELEVKENPEDLLPNSTSEATAIGFDERMLLHFEVELKPHPHPERPDRLRVIAASLATAGIYPGRCYPIGAREITKEELQQVHSHEHIEAVDLTSHTFSSYFTSDTYANEHSACAARLAAGLCADLASSIFSKQVKNGFALVRPPGHHAGVRDSMGFCLHNNAAIAAVAGLVAGAKKVLILDWDVHHGNGTQEIFEQNKSVLYISLHRHEKGSFYPGTGAAIEVGSSGGEGFCVNIPWSSGGVGDKDYLFAFEHVVMPIGSYNLQIVIFILVLLVAAVRICLANHYTTNSNTSEKGYMKLISLISLNVKLSRVGESETESDVNTLFLVMGSLLRYCKCKYA
uniref:histone deacetylase n=1 Tax=Kalanchoe fedtschenkoi TaxID=63787 RepID=A0A7N0U502_KALFE